MRSLFLGILLVSCIGLNAAESKRYLSDIQTTAKLKPDGTSFLAVNRQIFSTTTATTLVVEDVLFPTSRLSNSLVYSNMGKAEVSLSLKHPGDQYNTANPFIYNLPLEIKTWSPDQLSTDPPKITYTTLTVTYKGPNATNHNQLSATLTMDKVSRIEVSQVLSGTRLDPTQLQNQDIVLDFNVVLTANRVFKLSEFEPVNTYSFKAHNLIYTNATSSNTDQGNVARIEIENAFKYSPPTGFNVSDAKNMQPEAYDLEWAFIDFNSALAIPIQNFTNVLTTFNYNFSSWPLTYSRTTLTKSSVFDIPLMYRKGFVAYRIRSVTYDPLGQRIEGDWTYQNGNNYNIFPVNPHELFLNWTSSISFGEEGKRKEAVSYFDGTQRERFSGTLNNSNKIGFFSESFYDFEGRKTLSTLPAPFLQNENISAQGGNPSHLRSNPASSLQFYPGMTLNHLDKAYKEEDFNKVPNTGCLPLEASPMSTNSGASQYYSPNNFLHENPLIQNRYLNYYIPDAKKYPFIHTKFTTDGTNRVASQSGVGEVHRLGSNHETKYFYSAVNSQQELDRFFGTEVGRKEFYNKTYVDDPNGQTSVSYLDVKGRTIATALIGNKPNNLEPIASDMPSSTSDYPVGKDNLVYEFVSDRILTRDYSNLKVFGSTQHYIASNNETLNYDFNFTTSGFNQDLCKDNTGCADCFYDMNFTITDNCGTIIKKETLQNYDPNPNIDWACNNTTPSPRPNVSMAGVQVNFPLKGQYQMTAEASVPEHIIDAYTDKYMADMENCAEYDIQTMIKKNMDAIDPFSCINSCESCKKQKDKGIAALKTKIEEQLLGVKSQFSPDNNYQEFTDFVNTKANEQWTKLVTLCDEMCEGGYKVECASYRQALLQDVGPNGQYGFTINPDGTRTIEIKNGKSVPSVMYAAISNPLFLKPDGTQFASGEIDKVLDNWKIEWSAELVKYHPEYCYYINCLNTESVSAEFDKEFDKLTTLDCSVITNSNHTYQATGANKLFSILNQPTKFPYADFKAQHDNYRFFYTGTDPNIKSRPLPEWAFIFAFGRYPEFSYSGSISTPYTLNHFRNNNGAPNNGNNCLPPGYCQQDQNLYWHYYKILLKSLKDHFKNISYRPSTNSAATSSPSTGCYPNEYISCGTKSQTQTDPKENSDKSVDKNKPSGMFDELFNSDPDDQATNCKQYDNTVIMNFGSLQFKGEEFATKRRVFPDVFNTTKKVIQKLKNLEKSDQYETAKDDIDKNGKEVICNQQASGWLRQIEECTKNRITVPGSVPSGYDLVAELRRNFIDVCKIHCGETGYNFGTKSIDPARPKVPVKIFDVPNTASSFQEVIDLYKNSTDGDPFCTSDLISLPDWGSNDVLYQDEQVELFSKPNGSCECEQVRMWQYKHEKEGAGRTFYQYMKDVDVTFNLTTDELTQVLDGCASTDIKCRFFAKAIKMPQAFMCKKYYTCFELAVLKDGFNKKYKNWSWGGEPRKSLVYQNALTGYFNSMKGMNLTFYDYDIYMQACEGCMPANFIERRSRYQQIYNDFVALPANKDYPAVTVNGVTTPAKRGFPFVNKDNLRMLAKYFKSQPGIVGETSAITDATPQAMIKLLCDYLISTKQFNSDGSLKKYKEIPCCLTDLYYEKINQKPRNTSEPGFKYHQMISDLINLKGGYRLSLSDITVILKNCGDITLDNSYSCCHLETEYATYKAFTPKQKLATSIAEYLNYVFAQNKIKTEFDAELNLCKGYKKYFPKSKCIPIAGVSCEDFSKVYLVYESYLNATPGNTPNYSLDKFGKVYIDWLADIPSSMIDEMKNHANQNMNPTENISTLTPASFKFMMLSNACDKKRCNIIKSFIEYYKINKNSNQPLSNLSPTKSDEFIKFLVDQTRIDRSSIVNMLKTCAGVNIDFCTNFTPIYTKYKAYVTSNNNCPPANFTMSWHGNTPQILIDYLRNNTVFTGLNAADLKYLNENYRSCLITDECVELKKYFNCYVTSKGYGASIAPTNSFIPPSKIQELKTYLSNFMGRGIIESEIEKCYDNKKVFCLMYAAVYGKYVDYLNTNNTYMDWNSVPPALITKINTELGLAANTITGSELRFLYNNYKGCFITECQELQYHYNRFRSINGILPTGNIKPNQVNDFIYYLNAHLDKNEGFAYWSKRLKDCNVLDICAIFQPITDYFVQYHIDNPNFEIDWTTSLDANLLQGINGLPDCDQMDEILIKEAFLNDYCFDRFNCTLVTHYYDIYLNQIAGGSFLMNGAHGLTELIAYLNEKFLAEKSFVEWVTILRACGTNIDDYLVPCDQQRTCLINVLVEYDTRHKLDIINMDPLLNPEVFKEFLNICVPNDYLYSVNDWRLLFTLCDFNDPCFDEEVFAGRYVKTHTLDNNQCNIQNYYDAYKAYLFTVNNPSGNSNNNGTSLSPDNTPPFPVKDSTSGPPTPPEDSMICFNLSTYCPGVIERLGLKDIKCDLLRDTIRHFICSTDPMNYIDRTILPPIFYKGKYIEDLRNFLNNNVFNTNLSICDYELLLEGCYPCELGDFFELINFEYLDFCYHRKMYRHTGETGNKVSPCANPRGKFFSKIRRGGLWVNNAFIPNVETIWPAKGTPFVIDHTMYDGFTQVQYYKKYCMEYCSMYDGTGSKGKLRPKCDKSVCADLVACFEDAKALVQSEGGLVMCDPEEKEFWFKSVADLINHCMYSDDDYKSEEEIQNMLLCCNVDIECLDCSDLLDFFNQWKANKKIIYDDFPEAEDDYDLLRLWMNSKTGLDKTADYWLAKLLDDCEFLEVGTEVPCQFLKSLLDQDKTNPWSKDIWEEVNTATGSGTMPIEVLMANFIRCLSCEEFLEYMEHSVQFRDILINFYNGVKSYGSIGEMLDYYLELFGCSEMSPLDKQVFLQKIIQKMQNPVGGPPLPPSAPPSMRMPSMSAPPQGEKAPMQMMPPKSSVKVQGFPAMKKPVFAAPPVPERNKKGRSRSKPMEMGFSAPSSSQSEMGMSAPQSKEMTMSAPEPMSYEPPNGGSSNGGGSGSSTEHNPRLEMNFVGTGFVQAFGPYKALFSPSVSIDAYKCCNICDLRLYDRAMTASKYKEEDPCDYQTALAITNARNERERIFKELAINFRKKYIEKCLEHASMSLKASGSDREHHYTLYFYGQTGNLIQTIPPAGVKKFTAAADFAAVDAHRAAGTSYVPKHTLPTKYWYNMAGRVIKQKTPDAGEAVFVYDEYGRLILSQNAKQYPLKVSYRIYDRLSRILESGELEKTSGSLPLESFNQLYETNGKPNTGWMSQANRHLMRTCNYDKWREEVFPNCSFRHVMRNYYDRMNSDIVPPNYPLIIQENLNKRIVATTLDELDTDHRGKTFSSALYYSYDILGNVKNLHTYTNSIHIPMADRVKRVDYAFDLQSGKVNKVFYQKGSADQYIHRYEYDAENRLTTAWTSFDDNLWEREASYTYYLHGPLARVELGEHQVQGLDYIYTIQGWLKSINGSQSDVKFEPGQDGIYNDGNFVATAPGSMPIQRANNKNVARDAMALSLGYFHTASSVEKDYSPIHTITTNLYNSPMPNSLFNGNIPQAVVTQTALGIPTMKYEYRYDQLNRLVEMYTNRGPMSGFAALGATKGLDYAEKITYDPNGNILSYKRDRDALGTSVQNMDDLSYRYYYYSPTNVLTTYDPKSTTGQPPAGSRLTNQLAQVIDAQGNTAVHDLDIETQTNADNYQYDAIGNLIHDKQENMDIQWNQAGKIERIINRVRNKFIEFKYNPMGQRILKLVYNNSTGTGTPSYTYYQRDAQGNTLATYTDAPVVGDQTPRAKLSELHIYGSSRLGIKMPKLVSNFFEGPDIGNVINTPQTEEVAGTNYDIRRVTVGKGQFEYMRLTRRFSGMSQYELTNHLGNVLTTIKDEPIYDRQMPNASNLFTKAFPKRPFILTATDYYPFGMPMPNRIFSSSGSKYRFGFNTQEKDDEVYGPGNLMSAEFWEYDTRIGRRWNRDPVFKVWESPYVVNSNNPNWISDPNGDNGGKTSKEINQKQTERYQKKWNEKVELPLQAMEQALTAQGTMSREQIMQAVQDYADQLSIKYQNTRWLQYIYSGYKEEQSGNDYKSSSTGREMKNYIKIIAYRSNVQRVTEANSRPADATMSHNVITRTNAEAGSTVNVSFNPLLQPNSLVVSTGSGPVRNQIVSTGGMVNDPVNNSRGTFIYNYTVVLTTVNAGRISYTINNSNINQTSDDWEIRITIISPLRLSPRVQSIPHDAKYDAHDSIYGI